MDKENLYQLMESERVKVPYVSKKDFIPNFVVSLLRDRVCPNSEESPFENSNLFLRSAEIGETEDKWTGDSLMEEFTDLENSFLLSEENLAFCQTVLSFSVQMNETFDVDCRTFLTALAEEIEFPSLELLWLLDEKYSLISLTSYLMRFRNSPQIKYLQRQLISFCTSTMHFDNFFIERSTCVLEYLLKTFIFAGYLNPENSKDLVKLGKMSRNIMFQITTNLVSNVTMIMTDASRYFLLDLFHGLKVPNFVKRKYFASQLTQLLTTIQSKEDEMSLEEVIQYQERFSDPNRLDEHRALCVTVDSMISTPLNSQEMIQIISTTSKNPSRNWNTILCTITTWLERAEYGAVSSLKEIIKTLMQEGLSGKDKEQVTIAFILARHCSRVAPKIFSRYEMWYTHMFKDENFSPAKEPESFVFLTNLLTEWIPFEPNCFVQLQATHWPFIPFGLRGLWVDYVNLAKIRAAEYSEVENAMEFEPNFNNPILHEVEVAIKEYENSNKIPQSIFQLRMFRKPYYLEKFLPTLLQKAKGKEYSDARFRLIEALNQAKHIPSEMYSTYKHKKKQ